MIENANWFVGWIFFKSEFAEWNFMKHANPLSEIAKKYKFSEQASDQRTYIQVVIRCNYCIVNELSITEGDESRRYFYITRKLKEFF